MEEKNKKLSSQERNLEKFFMIGVLICAAFFVGQVFGKISARDKVTITQLREQPPAEGSQYKFIQPLLGCLIGGENEEDPGSYTLLRNELMDIISTKKQNKEIASASVYVDTRNGKWLGINTEEKYVPASLLKVVDMLAVFREYQADPNFLEKQVLYENTQDPNATSYFKPKKSLLSGVTYSVEEMMQSMILYSDNSPIIPLENLLGEDRLQKVFTSFGVTLPPAGEKRDRTDFMTVKSYANFFRALYNATYLRRSNSEKALELLSRTNFSEGIRAGIPASVVFSGKFGERSLDVTDPNGEKELHDCGIVYFPGHPYLICIMTKGKDFGAMSQTLGDISQKVYQFIEQENKK